jgi:hypothetical protein
MPKLWVPGITHVPYTTANTAQGLRPMTQEYGAFRKVTWHVSDGPYTQTPQDVHNGAKYPYHIIYNLDTNECIQTAPADMGTAAVHGTYPPGGAGSEWDVVGKYNVQICIVGTVDQIHTRSWWNPRIKEALRTDSNGNFIHLFPKIIQWMDTLGVPRRTRITLKPGITIPRYTTDMKRPLRKALMSGHTVHGCTPSNTDRYDGIYYLDEIFQAIPVLGRDGKPLKNQNDKLNSSKSGDSDIPDGYGLFEKNYKVIVGDTLNPGVSPEKGLSPNALLGARVIAAGWSPDIIKEIGTRSRDSLNEHPSGKAIDCVIRNANVKDKVDDMVKWLIKNADEMAIGSIIWYRQQWTSGDRKWVAYTGTNPHTDHVHVFFNGAAKPGYSGHPRRGDPDAVATRGKYRPLPPRVLDRGTWKGVTVHTGASQGASDPVPDEPTALVVSYLLAGKYTATALSMSGIRDTSGETGQTSFDIVGAVYPVVSDLAD